MLLQKQISNKDRSETKPTMKSKRRNSFIAAVDQNFIDCESASHHGKSRRSYPITFYKIVNAVALNFLDDPDDRKYYADSYSCSPPPLFILTITIIEVRTTIAKLITTILTHQLFEIGGFIQND